jgi:hypothetical protein
MLGHIDRGTPVRGHRMRNTDLMLDIDSLERADIHDDRHGRLLKSC